MNGAGMRLKIRILGALRVFARNTFSAARLSSGVSRKGAKVAKKCRRRGILDGGTTEFDFGAGGVLQSNLVEYHKTRSGKTRIAPLLCRLTSPFRHHFSDFRILTSNFLI